MLEIDGTRLAALAFGQYRPISHKDKAANRRIEIVLVPKREVLQKVETPVAAGSGSAAVKGPPGLDVSLLAGTTPRDIHRTRGTPHQISIHRKLS